jgi:uncharacterized protein (TIGR00369 family)
VSVVTAAEAPTLGFPLSLLPPGKGAPRRGGPAPAVAWCRFGATFPFLASTPFVEHLGFTLEHSRGASRAALRGRPEHLNSFGVTHGGALMTLLDVVMATAARSVAPDMGVVTIEMKTSFMQPARGPPWSARAA